MKDEVSDFLDEAKRRHNDGDTIRDFLSERIARFLPHGPDVVILPDRSLWPYRPGAWLDCAPPWGEFLEALTNRGIICAGFRRKAPYPLLSCIFRTATNLGWLSVSRDAISAFIRETFRLQGNPETIRAGMRRDRITGDIMNETVVVFLDLGVERDQVEGAMLAVTKLE